MSLYEKTIRKKNMKLNNINSFLGRLPIVMYNNPYKSKFILYQENKNKSGIYR